MMGRSQEEPWFIFEMISFWILQKFAKPRITKWQTSHLADLNLLNPSSHLLRCNHHVRHLNKEFYLLLKIVRTMHHLCKHGNCLWKDRHKDGSVRRNFCRAFWGCRHLNIKTSIRIFLFWSGVNFQESFQNPTVVTDGRVVPTKAGGGNGTTFWRWGRRVFGLKRGGLL